MVIPLCWPCLSFVHVPCLSHGPHWQEGGDAQSCDRSNASVLYLPLRQRAGLPTGQVIAHWPHTLAVHVAPHSIAVSAANPQRTTIAAKMIPRAAAVAVKSVFFVIIPARSRERSLSNSKPHSTDQHSALPAAVMGWSAPLHSSGLAGQNDGVISTTERTTWARWHESGLTWRRRLFT